MGQTWQTPAMRRLVYGALVCLMSMALVASGAVAQPCVAAQSRSAASAHATHHAAPAAASAHQAAHSHLAAVTESLPAKAPADHGCIKCCGLYTLASIVPPTVEPHIAQSASYTAYAVRL